MVNGQSGGILVVLVLGAGTDYALLLVARYREELRRHEDRHEAMAVALRRAGPAIIASAGTVIVGMLCLLVAESADISGLGPVAAIGIAVGLLAMITLLPALLVIFGRWVFWPLRPRYRLRRADHPRVLGAGRAADRPSGPAPVWVATAVLLACAWLGLIGFKVGPLTTAQSFAAPRRRRSPREQVLAQHFPAGAGEPVAVIGNAAAAAQLRAALAGVPGHRRRSARRRSRTAWSSCRARWPASRTARPPTPPSTGSARRCTRSPARTPRSAGRPRSTLDVERYATRDRNVIIPLVLLVVLLILGLLLRSVVAPLLLIGTVVLSFGAALGLSALVFRHVFGFAGADTAMPLFVFVFLVALGIDYNIFLMTRVREEASESRHPAGRAHRPGAPPAGSSPRPGWCSPARSRRWAPCRWWSSPRSASTVAIGVLLDTIIVRSVLVTALTLDVGRWIWWPSRLARPSPAEISPQEAAVVSGQLTAAR